MTQYVDIHSHDTEPLVDGIISHPTLSVTDDIIFSFDRPFWCGLHPCEKMSNEKVIERLERVKEHIIGVGEIGLDALCGDIMVQREAFECQLDFAQRNNLPVTIHAVKSYNDIVEIMRRRSDNRVVIHSFISHPVVAQHLLDVGCYLSFGESSLRSSKSVDAMRRMPIERLLLETDTGGDIYTIYDRVAQIKGVSLEYLKEQIYDNYRCLIG